MKKPMTTEEFFNKIYGILKEKGELPDVLDFGLVTNNSAPIRTYQFDLKNNLNYGGSEGIYLDLWIEYFTNSIKILMISQEGTDVHPIDESGKNT